MRKILLSADTRDDAVWGFDEVQEWDPGDVVWLQTVGLLKEGPRARDVYLWECDAQEVFEPQWVSRPGTGESVGLCVCHRCGTTHTVAPERMRTWITTFGQVTRVLSQALGSEAEILLHDHVARLGEQGGYELFLARGLRWRAGLVTECSRLRDTRAGIVLSLGAIPERHLWPAGWHQVLRVQEHLRIERERLILPIAIAPTEKAATAEQQLTLEQRDILEALAGRRGEPLLIIELEQAAGYSRHTVVKAVQRLESLHLVIRPGTRKGVSITHRGRELLAQ